MTQNKMKWVPLSDYLEPFKKKCGDANVKVSGVDINKQFIDTRAVMDGIDVSKYYIVPPKHFACNLMHIGRDERLPVAYNSSDTNYVVTSAYYVFRVKESKRDALLDEFLYIFFTSPEIDRLTWFYTDSSIRGNLKEDRFLDMQIPLPSIDEQKRIVETWKRLRMVKEQNEAIAEPLFQLCQSKIQNLKHTCQFSRLGNYICERNERNSDNRYGEDSARGVNTNKEIQSCKRLGEKLDSYKIICPRDIIYNCNIKLTQSTEKLAIALFEEENKCIVTNFYTVFYIKDHSLIEEFLMLWLVRDEFARYVKFMSCSSVRDRFDFSELQETYIPIPSIEIQRAIVNIYKCAKEAKRIAEEADKLSRELCPALIQKVIHA